jgi:hypothetical protein
LEVMRNGREMDTADRVVSRPLESASVTDRLSAQSRFFVLGAVLLAILLSALDQTIVVSLAAALASPLCVLAIREVPRRDRMGARAQVAPARSLARPV